MVPHRGASAAPRVVSAAEAGPGKAAPNNRLPDTPHFAVPAAISPCDSAASTCTTLGGPNAQGSPFVRGFAAVFAWEIKAFFCRPSSYVLLLAAALLAGWSFSWLVTLLARGADAALRPTSDPIAQFLGPNLFLIGGCTLLVPLLTMNTIADERRRATWELLVTAPVSPLAVVLGKFAAAWSLYMTCLAPWVACLAVLRSWNGKTKMLWDLVPWIDGPGLAFDPGPAAGGVIALAIVGASFIALGILCSGICRGPASASLLSLVAMGMILVIGLMPRILEFWGFAPEQIRPLELVSCWGHVERFSRGVLEPRIIAGHLSFCAIVIWAAAHVARRVDEAK